MHERHEHRHSHDEHHHQGEDHGHSHGLVDASILRSREGVRAVGISLGVLLLTALLQGAVFWMTNSVSLLADVIHNFGDALTAIPLTVAFLLRDKVAEKYAGYFVVLTIFVSGCVVAIEAIQRLFHPQSVEHLLALTLGGVIGFLGNEFAAVIRLRAGKHLQSPALIADGQHARIDGFVSLSVIATAIFVGFGIQAADSLIAVVITAVILRVTYQSMRTIHNS